MNVAYLIFQCKSLFEVLTEKLAFLIGKKDNLYLSEEILKLPWEKFKFILRGLADTDESLYFEKITPNFIIILL